MQHQHDTALPALAGHLSCPVCGTDVCEIFCSTSRAPLICHLRYTDADESQAAQTGQISLARCSKCGMVYNRDFEQEKLTYEVAYDNALHFSTHFRTYAEQLAADLCERHGIQNCDVAEIGCGDGYFLNLICEAGGNRGWGFDPTAYKSLEATSNVTLIRGYFDLDRLPGKPKLIVCRHVLEHIPEPQSLLREVRRACEPGQTVVYFEVPDARFTLERGGLWDILYEHCSYYTPAAIRCLFESEGFCVSRVSSGYDGQFLQLEAFRAADVPPDPPDVMVSEVGEAGSDTAESTRIFGDQFRTAVEGWKARLQQFSKEGKRVALWGAGTKGVMFLNVVGAADAVSCVVDLNPGKHGTFLAGTGVPVVAPDSLRDNPPDVVVLMNPAYREEVARDLDALDLRPSLVTP